jgi:uncharacterized membrane protein YfbV (UPF0208 family)
MKQMNNKLMSEFSVFYYSGQDNQLESAVLELLKAFKVNHQGFVYNGSASCWELKGDIMAIHYETLESQMKTLMKSMSRSCLDIKPIF